MTSADGTTRTLTRMQRLLLASGVLSTVLYAAMNVLVPLQWPGYSSVAQTISELSAIGAPTRSLWIPLGVLYSVLVTAFGWGVWATTRGSRRLRVVAALRLVYGLSGFAWFFAPMHLRGVEPSLTDVVHVALGCGTSVVYMAMLVIGSGAFGQRFRLYSWATLALLLVTGILTGLESPAIGRGLPTPTIGVWERAGIGVSMLWIAVLSVALLRGHRAASVVAAVPPGPAPRKKVTAFVGCSTKKHTHDAGGRPHEVTS